MCESGNYLIHHGIKNQKWGVRRFQNEDGTLTEAGKKRYGSYEKKLEKLNKKYGIEKNQNEQKEEPAEETPKKRTLSDLSDDELNTIVNRLDKEKRYTELMQERAYKLDPKSKPLIDGRKIAGNILTNSLEKVGTDTFKYALGTGVNYVAKSFGLKDDITSEGYGFNSKKKQKEEYAKQLAKLKISQRDYENLNKELNRQIEKLKKEGK